MTTRLQRIRFTRGLKGYGFQEISDNGILLHLYNNEGDQLDGGNGYFPSAKFVLIEDCGEMDDSDDFWSIVSRYQD